MSKYFVVKSLVLLQLLGACAMSFMHIMELGHHLGLGWQAWVAPFVIDGFALLGALGRSPEFDAATRKMGLRIMIAAGTVSLAANVGVGTNWGQRVWGVIVVAGAIVAEMYASKLTKAPEVVAAAEFDAEKAKRTAAALKGAKTRRDNKARDERAARAADKIARQAAKERLAPANA
jgi:hypothetical protein